jgi:hypothetical protein
MTASAVESHEISDAALATFTYTGSFTEVILHDDSFQAGMVYTAGGAEVYLPAAETGTGLWVITFSIFEEFGKIDSATAIATFLPVAPFNEGRVWSDAFIVPWVLSAGLNAEAYYVETGTAIWQWTVIPLEEQQIKAEFGTALWTFTTSALDVFAILDSGTATWKFTAGAVVERFDILDYYLTATQSRRLTLSQTHHFNSVQSRQWVTKQSRRYGVIYKGRGFLSG